jgi:hypothetical protein
MTVDQAKAAIYTAIAAIVTLSGSPGVIWAHQSYNAPKTPHVRLTAFNDTAVGRTYRTSTTEVAQQRTLDVQVDGIGDTAAVQVVILDAMVEGDHPAIRTLSAAGVAVQATTGVQDIAEKGPSGWIARKSLTITFGYTLTVSDVAAGDPATAIVVDLEADTNGDNAIDVVVDPLHTTDLT